MFIRYADGVKGFKLIDPRTRKVTYSRNIIFREDLMWSGLRGSIENKLELGNDHDISTYPEEVETYIPSFPPGQHDAFSPRRHESSPTPAANPPDPGGDTAAPPQHIQQQENQQLQEPGGSEPVPETHHNMKPSQDVLREFETHVSCGRSHRSRTIMHIN